jgi:hypothetical protein
MKSLGVKRRNYIGETKTQRTHGESQKLSWPLRHLTKQRTRQGRIDDAQGKWNGTKKVMKRWNEHDVFCCYNAFETFVAVS